jgi:hypothetical protein
LKNLLVNFSVGDKCIDSLEGDIFLNSLAKFNTFEKAVFVSDVSPANIKKLKKYFDIIIPNNENLYTSYLALYNWLSEHVDEYKYVMHSDLRDVVIQKDPFEFFESQPNVNMFYSLEGMKIQENDCNLWWEQNLRTILRSHNTTYQNEYVINGGIFGGKIEHMINHCLMMFSNTNRKSQFLVMDQQFLGYLSQFLKKNSKNMLCHPYNDTFACTGEAIKRDNVEVYFDGQYVTNKDGVPYCIFHQWDRTELADKIREKETNTLRFSL